MARHATVQLIDDLDGSPADVTLRFSWDGATYEIDLSAAHAEQFGTAVRPYLDAARRVGSARRERRAAKRPDARAGRARAELTAIRSWARANGLAVADRGRIPADVIDAYRASRAATPEARPELGATTATSEPDASEPSTRASSPKTSAAAQKSRAKQTVAKATAAKKSAAKKAAAKKAAAKKRAAKKSAAKKSAAKKALPAKSTASAQGRVRKSTTHKPSTGTAAERTH